MEQRLASRLLRLAQLIGATRQRVNQILKGWERDRGVEQQYGSVLLLDRARLEKLARM